jgi:ubiquinone/menaquinone biosynthesis C-methylase UbiE
MGQSKFFKKAEILLSRARKVLKEKGTYYVFRAGIKRITSRITNCSWYYYYKIFKSWRTFKFQGKTYRYFYHRYNRTWKTERAIQNSKTNSRRFIFIKRKIVLRNARVPKEKNHK